MFGSLQAQASSDFGAFDTVNPGKMIGDQARFVALDASDEMPFDI